MFKTYLENVRKEIPLIHNITNYVTVNDCANIILACGASPIMADDEEEVEEITSICDGLNINIGTLNKRTINSMFMAGKKANEKGNTVVLDPVGIGASKLRRKTVENLLEKVKINVICGNISEIKAIFTENGTTKGVDANIYDEITKDNIDDIVAFAKKCAKKVNSIIAITGLIDVVTDGEKAYCIYNGNKMMAKVTGTGCQLSALIASFIAGNKKNQLEATFVAVCCMGLAGEIAYKRLNVFDGNSSYRNYIIDAIYNLKAEDLEKGARYEIR